MDCGVEVFNFNLFNCCFLIGLDMNKWDDGLPNDDRSDDQIERESVGENDVSTGNRVGGVALLVILGVLAALAFWLASPSRFGFVMPIAIILIMGLVFKFLM